MLVKKLNREWFDKIKLGLKIYEGRPRIGDWITIDKDDIIEFFCDLDRIKVKIIERLEFNNFESALALYGEQMLPGRHPGEWNDVYYKTESNNGIYDQQLIEVNGVVILKFILFLG